MKIAYHLKAHWPSLSWLAQCSSRDETIQVFHGRSVETKDQWFCEAVWAGDFEEGGFDQTDLVFGSGGRIRKNSLCFVSSGSNLDRLHTFVKDGITFVSNSLICMLAWIDGAPLIDYCNYSDDFANYRYTIFGQRTIPFPSTAGTVNLTYFSNLIWNGEILKEQDKPCSTRLLNRFDVYYKFLQDSMALIAENAQIDKRSQTYKLLCPLSNGYDSPTVASLLKEVKGVGSITFDVDRHGGDDSGEAIAAALGIPCNVINRDAWRKIALAEVPFLAGSGSVGDLAFKPAETHMQNTVLMLGNGGDLVWNKHSAPASPIAVGGGSMLGMTEYRLWTGFIICPVGLWGIRQLQDILQISQHSEMKQWDVGGNYTRPICRRIIEQAGVPRSMFGGTKRGVSVVSNTRKNDLNKYSQGDLLSWLKEQRKNSIANRSLPHPWLARIFDGIIAPLEPLVRRAAQKVRQRSFKWLAPPINYAKEKMSRHYYHHRYRVHWSIDRAKRRYQELE